jgi:hypothetical protein
MDIFAGDKHFSLLQAFIKNGCKKFNNVGPRGQCYKAFYSHKLRARVFVPRKLFQGSVVIAGKAGAYSSETPFRCFTVG